MPGPVALTLPSGFRNTYPARVSFRRYVLNVPPLGVNPERSPSWERVRLPGWNRTRTLSILRSPARSVTSADGSWGDGVPFPCRGTGTGGPRPAGGATGASPARLAVWTARVRDAPKAAPDRVTASPTAFRA